MARAVLRQIVIGLASAGLLMGCVEGGGSGAADGSAGASAPAARKAGARDVEAPDVFQATDSALWDGRPSLGGIWVASPDVTDPERVVMVNPANGKTVNGALFRRERDNPGPRLQLSSDAAEALGILAGQPTEIQVTAIRKAAEVEAVAEEETAAAEGTDAVADATPAADGEDAEAAAIASAALEAVDAEAPAPAPAGEDGGSGEAAAAVAATGAAAVIDEAPKRKTWKERRAEAKAAREAKKKAAAEAKAAAAAAEAAAAGPLAEGVVAGEAPAVGTVEVAPIDSAPLDARNPEAPAEPEPEAAAAPAPAAPAPVVASGTPRPIQVASFSKEENANRAAEALAKIGITATPQKSDTAGKAVWGVVVMGDDAMLQKIKEAGFADAFYLK